MRNNLSSIFAIAILYLPTLLIERIMGWTGLTTLVGWIMLYLMMYGYCNKQDEHRESNAAKDQEIVRLKMQRREPPPPEDMGGVSLRGVV